MQRRVSIPPRVIAITRRLLPYLLIAALTWVAHFWRFRQFGLYEDDYVYIGRYLDATFPIISQRTLDALTHWPYGRPLVPIIPMLITVLLYPIGGLPSLYIAAFGITALCGILFYRLAKRLTGSELFAVISTIAFTLFPADTTHTFLVHAFTYRIAVTCTLWAVLLYLKDRRLLAYEIAFISLMLYEPPILILMAAPLLANRWRNWRDALRHNAICVGLILVTVLIRILGVEPRLVSASGTPIETIKLVAFSLIAGPLMAARQLSYGPLRTIAEWDTGSIIAAVLIVPALYLWLRRAWSASRDEVSPSGDDTSQAAYPLTDARSGWALLAKLIVISAIVFVIAYLFAFTHNVLATRGRLTSAHFTAAIGGSLVFGGIAFAAWSTFRSHAYRHVLIALLAIHFAVSVGYRSLIQADFAESWRVQRWYWTNVVALNGDMTDGTVILVQGPDVPPDEFIERYSWADSQMLGLLFHIPNTWAAAPLALPLFHGAAVHAPSGANGLFWDNEMRWYPLEAGNIVLLREEGDRIVRIDDASAVINGVTLSLRPPSSDTQISLPHRLLYDLLVDESLLR